MPNPVKVFISYTHDSPEHEAKVLALANRLRGDGIDAVLDQYETFPPRGWIQWMKHQVRDAHFILVVCTETYRQRWDGDEKAGVGFGAIYESGLIQQLLYDAGGVNEQFVPVLLGGSDREHIPLELRRYSHFAAYIEAGYDALYGLLTNQPKVLKPILAQALPFRAAKQDFRNLFWNAPPRNPFFTGRAMHLEAIRKALTQSSSAAITQPQAISGLGGVGKTQTAIEYAHVYRADYAAVLWSGADSRDALLSGFAAFANMLNLPQKAERDSSVVAAAVRRWLESNSRWLLVLDNVEELALIPEFAPAGVDGHLLITTRLRATGEFAESVVLKRMEPEEAALLLLRRAKVIPRDKSMAAAREVDRALAREISNEMDGLPLALDQAGAFIEEMPSTLAEYLTLYRQEGAALRARRGKQTSSHPPSITITFSLAFATVAKVNSAAADVVRGCAFLAPDAIPEEIFTEGGEAWGGPIAQSVAKPLAWVETLEEAGKFALIHRDAEVKNLYVHRLVQEVIKDELDQNAQCQWAERAVRAVARVFPNPEFSNWTQCERLLAHAQACAVLIEQWDFAFQEPARLLNQTASYLNARARYEEAEPLYQRVRAIQERTLGSEHSDVADSLNNLAMLYRAQGKYDEAEPLCQRALAIREKNLGPEHPDVAQSLNNVAVIYYSQGKYNEAEPFYQRALEIWEKALGPDHPDLATGLSGLASLYNDQGRYGEAEPLLQRSLAIREKALGPEHPDVAFSLNNLALLYYFQGKYTEAEPLHQRALSIWEKALGPEHPNVATSLNNLASLYRFQEKYDAAVPLCQRALAIWKKALGPEHPDVAFSLNSLASLYYGQGKHDAAEPLCLRALEIWEKALGPEHPVVAQSLNNLAEFYHGQGKHEAAEPLCQRALASRQKVLGPEHPDVAQSLNTLASLYKAQTRYDEAEPLCQRALAIRETALGPDHPVVAASLNLLASLCQDQGKYDAAEPRYQRALAIWEKVLGPDHPNVATALENYARLLRKTRGEARAAEMESHAAAIRAKHQSGPRPG